MLPIRRRTILYIQGRIFICPKGTPHTHPRRAPSLSNGDNPNTNSNTNPFPRESKERERERDSLKLQWRRERGRTSLRLPRLRHHRHRAQLLYRPNLHCLIAPEVTRISSVSCFLPLLLQSLIAICVEESSLCVVLEASWSWIFFRFFGIGMWSEFEFQSSIKWWSIAGLSSVNSVEFGEQ